MAGDFRSPLRSDANTGRVALVSGGGTGLGRATALELARSGAGVVLVGRRVELLERTRQEIEDLGGAALVAPADVREPEAVERVVDAAIERFGHVDVLVNNAGKSIRRSIELSYERLHDFERTMQLNYFGAVQMTLALLPSMRERQAGHIVNVSSVGVQARVPRFSAYVASKAALDAFSDCIAAEVAHDGVHITTIHMPLVRTPMIEPTKIYSAFPAISPEEAADRICKAIVFEPRRISTPLGNVAALANAISPTSMDTLRNLAFQLFPDSQAARGGDEEDGRSERISLAGTVFARVARGVHW
jgi:NAD(P)-dependent dehydrogenase (short-subunit alcohol dehydrogenase family)